jgi:hypothetical protein
VEVKDGRNTINDDAIQHFFTIGLKKKGGWKKLSQHMLPREVTIKLDDLLHEATTNVCLSAGLEPPAPRECRLTNRGRLEVIIISHERI